MSKKADKLRAKRDKLRDNILNENWKNNKELTKWLSDFEDVVLDMCCLVINGED